MDASAYVAYRDAMFEAIWRDVDPLVDEIEDTEHIPAGKLFPALRAMGAWGCFVPEEYGGAGLTVSQYLPIIAEFAKVHGGIRALVHVHNSFTHALAELGTPEQKADLLPGCAVGEMSVAFALTEPEHGTGLDLGTTAVVDGDEWVINGRKWLITNSDFASHFIVLAKTDPTDRARALTAIVVPRDTPGLTIEPLPHTMGCKGGQHGQLTFVDARVPVGDVLGGEVGAGEAQLEHMLEISRVLVAASSLGTAERALELAVEHAKARKTFGKRIGDRQAVQRYLAEMATDVYAMRTMLDDCARRWDAGERIPAQSAMTKLFCLEAVGRVTDRALLCHGGIGYTRRHRVELMYRDARLNWLEEGTPTIMHLVTAREVLAGNAP